MEPIVNRIQQLMTAEGLNSSQMSQKLDYKSSEKISRLFRKENAMPSAEIIIDIANKFENLNKDWFLTGNGAMYKHNNESNSDQDKNDLSFLNLKKPPSNELIWDRVLTNHEEIKLSSENQVNFNKRLQTLESKLTKILKHLDGGATQDTV